MENQGMGSHSEPFFELLQPNTPAISHSTGSSSSNYVPNGPRRADSSCFSLNDDVLPSYDFQPLRSNGSGGPRIEETGSKFSFEQQVRDPPVTYEKYESTRPRHDIDKDAYDSATVAAVERTMKKYADNLLRVLEGMGGRLSQLEATTQRLEHAFDKVKSTVANSHGETDGRLRMLENMVREVQRGVQVLRDKQEINEAQLQLKLQQEKTDTPATKIEVQAPSPPPPQSVSVPSAPHQPVIPQQVQPQAPLPQQQIPSAPHQPVIPQQVQPQAPAPAPPVQHVPQHHIPQGPHVGIQQQAPPPSQFSYHSSSPQALPPLQQQTQSYAHQPEAPPYPPPQAQHPHHQPPVNYNLEMPPPYLPSNYGPPQQRPVAPPPPPPPQQNQMYERTGSGPLALPPPPPPPYHSPQHSYESGYAPSYNRISSSGAGGSGGYPHLPTAQPIQQPVSARPPSRSGVDDVIDKVAAMGFSRDQVRATVQRLTENGQPVDMNVVLDKLMNGGSEAAPPAKGWFGR